MTWQTLNSEAERLNKLTLKSLFDKDNKRFANFSIALDGLLFDYSKQKIDQQVKNQLINFADERNLKQAIKDLFSGEVVNHSEARAAHHTILRAEHKPDFVQAELDKMNKFCQQVRSGRWRGFSGERITDVVNIGVGGSDLGPKMVCHALSFLAKKTPLKSHFVSSIDGEQLEKLLRGLNVKTTLFIISSKTFTTSDTLANFEVAKEWLFSSPAFKRCKVEQKAVFHQHFVAVTANVEQAKKDFQNDSIFQFWHWVGGRFSLWSAIGLSIMLQLGSDVFATLHRGARMMDDHFQNVDFAENIPVLMALCEVWNVNFLNITNRVILPYSASFAELPSYLAQLEMESLGKSVSQKGQRLDYHTGGIILGEVGSNAQHAFYQLLHQGTPNVSMDFIALVNGVENQALNHLSLTNCLAQSQALAFGEESDNPYQRYAGDKPSHTILLDKLCAQTLGMLLALYEHKVFTQSVLWQINAFDQWGVELGKKIAKQLINNTDVKADASTRGLLLYSKEHSQGNRQ